MREPRAERKRRWLVGLAGVVLIAAASWWAAIGPGGIGAGRGLSGAEECGIRVAGSSVLALTVMPDLVSAFLRQSGYEKVDAPNVSAASTSIVGRRGHVRCTIEIGASTAVDGLDELARGTARIALAGRPINDRDISRLAAAGAGDFSAEQVSTEHVVAIDAAAVIVNKANVIKEISVDQIRDIAIGATRNYSALGGADAPISLYLPLEGNRADDFPNDSVTTRHPAFESIGQRAKLFSPEAKLFASLRADRNGLSVVSLATLPAGHEFKLLPVRAGPTVSAATHEAIRDRRYPIIRRLFFYVRPEAAQQDPFVQRMVAFATSKDAAPVFTKHGFVPISEVIDDGAAWGSRPRCLLGTAEATAVEAATRGAQRFGQPLRFDAGGTALNGQSSEQLKTSAPKLEEIVRAGGAVVIVGHSDALGDPQRNRDQAQLRAVAVRAALEKLGVFGTMTESAGEMCHIAENVSEAGRKQNQRVEIWVRPPAKRETQP